MHALNRAMADITLGVVKSTRARDARDAEMGLTEIMQQFKINFSGVANTGWGFAPLVLGFDYPFYAAPGQRDPQFEEPQFWFGAKVSPVVAVSATVSQYTVDPDNGAIVGANIAIGVCGAILNVPYEGVVDLTFQGFSALSEDEADVNV
jgi:hypothetical protein